MIEIIVLYFLTGKIGNIASKKGLKPMTWKIYTVLAWFGCEFLGLIIGFTVFGSDNFIAAILVAMPSAVAGYHMVKSNLDNKPDIDHEIDNIGNYIDQ